jgi:hypothetical protein
MTSDAAARAREGLQQGFSAEPLFQRLAASLRACATFPAWDTRPTSLLVGPNLRWFSPLFLLHPFRCRTPWARALFGLTAQLQLEHMTRECGAWLGVAVFISSRRRSSSSTRLRASCSTCASQVIPRWVGATWVHSSAYLTLLTRADVLGSDVSLSKAPTDRF